MVDSKDDGAQDGPLTRDAVEQLLDIVSKVVARELPRDGAIGMLQAFFNLSSEQAEKILGPVGKTFFVETPKA